MYMYVRIPLWRLLWASGFNMSFDHICKRSVVCFLCPYNFKIILWNLKIQSIIQCTCTFVYPYTIMTLPLRLKITFNLIHFFQTYINSLNQNILSNIDKLKFGLYIYKRYIKCTMYCTMYIVHVLSTFVHCTHTC